MYHSLIIVKIFFVSAKVERKPKCDNYDRTRPGSDTG